MSREFFVFLQGKLQIPVGELYSRNFVLPQKEKIRVNIPSAQIYYICNELVSVEVINCKTSGTCQIYVESHSGRSVGFHRNSGLNSACQLNWDPVNRSFF